MGKLLFTSLLFLLSCTVGTTVFGQNTKTVSGMVTDSAGHGLQGVSVVVKGTKKGTVSDAKGAFNLGMPVSGGTLEFSLLGYSAKAAKIGSNSTVNIVLLPSVSSLNEAVVVAYGTQKKATLTGAVTEIKGDDIVKAPATNIGNSLAGRLPGLVVVTQSGEPGFDKPNNLTVRGLGTPLVIIDGVPGDFSALDPNEVESISVIKDASANVYGFRAANGAIIITTKKGKAGPPRINYTGFYGQQSNTIFAKFLNAGDFTALYDEGVVNGQIANNQPIAPTYGAAEVAKWKAGTDSGYAGTDWLKYIMRNSAPMEQHNVNISGGADKTTYFISAGFLDQNSIWQTNATQYKRYNLRGTVTSQISKRFTAQLNIGGSYENKITPGGDPGSIINETLRAYPVWSPFVNNNPDYFSVHAIPLAAINRASVGYYHPITSSVSTVGTLTYKVPYIEGLDAKVLYSYNYSIIDLHNYTSPPIFYNYEGATQTYVPIPNTVNPSLDVNHEQASQSQIQYSLNYQHSIGLSSFKGLLLYESVIVDTNIVDADRQFALPGLYQLGLGNQDLTETNTGSDKQTAYAGYVGRINYSYADKYLMEVGVRYDGSYKLPPSGRWGYFPEVSGGWVISKEHWFNEKILNFLKLRGSWGKAPDDAQLTGLQFYSGYNYPINQYVFVPGSLVQGLAPATIPNTILTWVKTTSENIGINAEFLNGTFSFTGDYFRRKRDGLPAVRAGVSVPSTSGLNLPQENLNSDLTRGFEIVLGFNGKLGDVALNISPNFSYTRTKNLHVEVPEYTNATSNYFGNSNNRYTDITWGYKYIGHFKSFSDIATSPVQDGDGNKTLLPGDLKYADLNHDGVINSLDQTIIGRSNTPDITYGMTVSASWKGFDIAVLFQGATAYSVSAATEYQRPFFNSGNSFEFFTDRWHRANAYDPNSPWIPGKYPAIQINGTANNNSYNSAFWLQNAWYLRVKTVNLGYSFNEHLLSRSNIKQIRIFMSAQNLFTATNVKYLDPENPNNGQYYPQQRVVTAGIQLTL